MIPEAAIAMLACARIGAAHSVVFGGFSAESLRDRINDAEAKLLITADGGYRRGGVVPLKRGADEALEREGGCPTIESVLVVRRHGADGETLARRADVGGPRPLVARRRRPFRSRLPGGGDGGGGSALHPLHLRHHREAEGDHAHHRRLLTQVYATTKWVFDLKDDDVYWCTADVGWVTGHSYIVYGPLANGATVVMYEGAPDHPDRDRFWELVEKHRVTIFYTAPTAIRAFMKWGTELPGAARPLLAPPARHRRRADQPRGVDLVPQAHRRRALPDRGYLVADGDRRDHDHPAAGPDVSTVPGSATRAFPGIRADILTLRGERWRWAAGSWPSARPGPPCCGGSGATNSASGDLLEPSGAGQVVGEPGNQQPGESVYFPGDGAKRDENGFFWVIGRIDDVLNVAGHRIGTMEVESALVDHQSSPRRRWSGRRTS
jgi:acetyl-CoA synthetase